MAAASIIACLRTGAADARSQAHAADLLERQELVIARLRRDLAAALEATLLGFCTGAPDELTEPLVAVTAAQPMAGGPVELQQSAVDEPEPPLGLGDLEEPEILLHICSFLDPNDLGHLACVSASFGRKTAWPHSAAGEPLEQHSVVEEMARRWMAARAAESEEQLQARVGVSWLRRMDRMWGFSCSHRCMELSQRGSVAMKICTMLSTSIPADGGGGLPAKSKVLTRLVERELPAALALDPAEGIRVLVADLLGTNLAVYASFRGPPESPYEDGTFTVQLCYPLDYPFKPPKLHFTHPVFHPNISANGQVVDWLPLKDGWSPAYGVSKLLLDLRTYLADTRCTLHSFPAPEGTPCPWGVHTPGQMRTPGTRGGLTVAVGGGQQVYVVGHEAASAWLSNPQMAEQQAREHTALYARHQ